MKKVILLVGGVVIATNVLSLQFRDSSWNWNNIDKSKLAAAPDSYVADDDMKDLEATAKLGECYTRAYVEGSCTIEKRRVVATPAVEETELVPAVTQEITDQVLISPARTVEQFVPALYENVVTERVLVTPERAVWKKGNFTPIQKNIDGETYCLVIEPAVYEDRVERVLRVPASTRLREIAAVYESVTRTVVIQPATTRTITKVPAVYKEVSSCIENEVGHYEWRSILCEQNATNDVLKNVERRLADTGHLSRVEVDGTIDLNTASALRAYQRANNLKVDGLVSIDTVKSLGVNYQ